MKHKSQSLSKTSHGWLTGSVRGMAGATNGFLVLSQYLAEQANGLVALKAAVNTVSVCTNVAGLIHISFLIKELGGREVCHE